MVEVYPNGLKNWDFGRAGAQSLNQQSGAEASQFQQVGRCGRIQNLGCPAQPKTNSSDHLGILYVDQHLLVLHKCAGLLTQPTQHENLSLESLGKQWLKEQYDKPGDVFLHALHRIDRPVSGIVLFARRSKALKRLNEMQRCGHFQKQYCAVVEGSFNQDSGTLENFLKRSSYSTQVVAENCEGGKRAVLKFEVLRRLKGRSVLKITLVTGRYHQIRAQLSALGHPIIGDTKYGSKVRADRVFLHHSDFTFYHPITGEQIHIQSPAPRQWFIPNSNS